MAGSPILKLNPDVLHMIFSLLKENSRQDILNAAKVCKPWHHTAKIVIDSTLDIIFTDRFRDANTNLLTRLANDKSLQSRVRHIVVVELNPPKLERALSVRSFRHANPWKPKGYFSRYRLGDPQDDDFLTATDQLAEGLAEVKLASFTWSALPLIPQRLISALARQPSCQLSIRRNPRAIGMCCRIYSPMLNRYAVDNLGSLTNTIVRLELIVPPEDKDLLVKLGHEISRASSLRTLKLRSIGHQWATEYVRDAQARSSEEFQRRNLSTVGVYQDLDWLVDPIQRSGHLLQLVEMELTRFCTCKKKTFSLASITDVSKLQKLKFDCFGFLTNPAPLLNPRSVRLELWRQHASDGSVCFRNHKPSSVQNVLRRWTSLEQLNLSGQADIGQILTEQFLAEIGPRLSSLTFRRYGPRFDWDEEERVTISETRLVALAGRYCQRLQHFGINAYDSNNLSKVPELFEAVRDNLDFVPHLSIFCHNALLPINSIKQIETQDDMAAFADPTLQSLPTVPERARRDDIPKPGAEPITVSNVHQVWNMIRRPSSCLKQLDLHFGKDWYFARNCFDDYQKYIGWGEDRRSLVIKGSASCENATRPQLHVVCPQLVEARTALRQRWWEPEEDFWSRRVQSLARLVGEELDG